MFGVMMNEKEREKKKLERSVCGRQRKTTKECKYAEKCGK